jgi:predicted transcriptional regulator YheO
LENISDELDMFKRIMKAIVAQFGDRCEVVLHDWLKGYNKSIVAIENGQVTNRKVGDCGSNLGLEVMRGTVKDGDKYFYITQTKDGRTLRSTTVYIRNSANQPIGVLCINMDISDIITFKSFIDSMVVGRQEESEFFANDVNELLDYLLQKSQNVVGKSVESMSKENKMKAIEFLDDKGAFLITKSGNKVCQYFDISKFTLYNYLDEIRNRKKRNNGSNGPNIL